MKDCTVHLSVVNPDDPQGMPIYDRWHKDWSAHVVELAASLIDNTYKAERTFSVGDTSLTFIGEVTIEEGLIMWCEVDHLAGYES